ncbi:hypothetical protein PT2222_50271 [Paraburkholderia tropica]
MIEIPVGQHPACAAGFLMARGPMRMTVNHRVRARALEQRRDAFRRHVVFRQRRPVAPFLARASRAFRERDAPTIRPREKQQLRQPVAREFTEKLIAAIVGAQGVAVRERDARAERGDRDGVGQPDCARRFHEAFAHQEIAIAVHDVQRDAALGERVHQRGHAREKRIGEHIVADPVFEEVAEYEHRVGLIGRHMDEVFERGDRVRNRFIQMQVRDEEKRARRVRALALAGHARGGVSECLVLQHR